MDPKILRDERKKIDLKAGGITTEEGITRYLTDLIDRPIAGIPAEAYQWIVFKPPNFLISKDLCENIQNYMSKIVNDPNMCAKRECPAPVFASYKMLLTAFIFCVIKRSGLVDDYSPIYALQPVVDAARYAEIYNLTNTYGIKDTNNITIKGITTSRVVAKTFTNLLKITAKSQNYISWIDYHYHRIGDASVTGIVTPQKVRSKDNLSFVIKMNSKDPSPSFVYESSVGIRLTQLRKWIPNFVMVYGGFQCDSSTDYSTLCIQDATKMTRSIQYIIMEKLEGQTFDAWIQRTPKYPGVDLDILAMMAQLCLALAFAQSKNRYVHNDFHSGNSMIVPNAQPYYYEYSIDGKKYVIKAPATPVIIDYEYSHVEGLRPHFQRSEKFNNTADCFTLFMHSLCSFVTKRSDIMQISRPLREFFRTVNNVYSNIFTQNILDIAQNAIDNRWGWGQTVEAFDKAREDVNLRHWIFYIPEKYENKFGPLDMFQVIVSILRTHGNSDYVEIPPNTNTKVCKWGDSGDGEDALGCDITMIDMIKRRSNAGMVMSDKIEKLKKY